MADKRIQDLTEASVVGDNDNFVLEQSGQAKRLTGQTLISELATALDGHGGIESVSYTPPVSPSLEGSLVITYADETESDPIPVENGRGISGITWTESGTAGNGRIHTGTITYNDGTTSSVVIQDGVKGDTGPQRYVWFKWADSEPTSDADMKDTAGAYIGIYEGLSTTAPTHYTDYTWVPFKGEKGDTGNSIQSITLTGTSGRIDTYTVLMDDGVTGNTFNVTNAKSIVSITLISGSHAAGTTDTYEILFNDGDTATFTVYNGSNGAGSVSTVSGIQAVGDDVPQVINGQGAPTTATVGQVNQLYWDSQGESLYYCSGNSNGAYMWHGTQVTIDNVLSGSSTRPVQNKVITAKVGTAQLATTAQNLSEAVNELKATFPAGATTAPLADAATAAIGTSGQFAKADHKHPINVPTTGVPADLGTASHGTATTYAKSDHVHNMPSAADVGAMPNDAQMDIEFWTLLNGAGVNAGTVSTYSSRNISDYKCLVAEWIVNNAIQATGIVRLGSFKAFNNLSLFYVDSVNTQRYCELSYISDTTIKLLSSSNASGVIFLYGIKTYLPI